MTSDADAIEIRPSRPDDRDNLLALLRPFVQRRKLLPRTVDELHELLARGFVASAGERIVGFAALDVYSKKLAEIRALVVDDDFQGRQIGKRLVDSCVDLARRQNVMEVMAISSAENFFRSCGFDYTLPDEKKAFFLQTGRRD